MEVSTDIGHQITARKLMHIMLYDNGAVNRFEPDKTRRYPKPIFDEIIQACSTLFDKHPDLLTDDNLEMIAAGCEDDVKEIFDTIPEYEALNEVLNRYFEIM